MGGGGTSHALSVQIEWKSLEKSLGKVGAFCICLAGSPQGADKQEGVFGTLQCFHSDFICTWENEQVSGSENTVTKICI